MFSGRINDDMKEVDQCVLPARDDAVADRQASYAKQPQAQSPSSDKYSEDNKQFSDDSDLRSSRTSSVISYKLSAYLII